MPEKYASGTDIANAQGQETTKNISPRYTALLKSFVIAKTIPHTAIATKITPKVYHLVILEITVSVLDFFSLAFSIISRILHTVLFSYLLVALILTTLSSTIEPDKTSSFVLKCFGKLSPVKL